MDRQPDLEGLHDEYEESKPAFAVRQPHKDAISASAFAKE